MLLLNMPVHMQELQASCTFFLQTDKLHDFSCTKEH